MLQDNTNSELGFDIPILLIFFNRPRFAAQVVESLRTVKPLQVYVTVDGPRKDNKNDVTNVELCKKLIEKFEWPCKVHTLFREHNLGCKVAVSESISWFFANVEKGIILEDDCVPDLTFFSYCKSLLNRYEDDHRVMHIGGCNLYRGKKWGNDSYFFSTIPHIWGWASWRRAWSFYDVEMNDYPIYKENGLINTSVTYHLSRPYWVNAFDDTYSGSIDTWDYQWVYAIWKKNGMSIIPNQNLVKNIGFGKDATHTIYDSEFANLRTVPMSIIDMQHPLDVSINYKALKYAFKKFYQLPSWLDIKIDNLKIRWTKFLKYLNATKKNLYS